MINSEYDITLDSGLLLHMRPMQSEDIDHIYELEKAIFPSPWSRSSFEAELLHDYSKCLVVCNENTRIAYTVFWIIEDELHIANLAVRESYRGLGIASWIMDIIFTIAHDYNIKIMHLEVRKSNFKAINLYQKYGFEIAGIRKNYYESENEDAILMSFYFNF
ncbi:ribosomal protein S18-alanine N-acetyltransferase [candidate division KSB1 bacterium]|nr:ribosomal protein S18-alanine N-acetyltransferase [candidate division KSB1 bacterium]